MRSDREGLASSSIDRFGLKCTNLQCLQFENAKICGKSGLIQLDLLILQVNEKEPDN